MSLTMERPDQDEESVKTGDTWTGPRSALRTVLHLKCKVHYMKSFIEGRLEKTDQGGSETRSTEFSDQDKEEWKKEPESGRAGDTWTGLLSVLRKVFDLRSLVDFVLSSIHHDIDIQRADQTGPRSASGKPHALRSSIPLPTGENLTPAAGDIDNDMADQHRSETRRTESSAWGNGSFSPKTWSAAAVWIMTALTVATSSLAGAECIGTEVKLDKGEAVLRCPLPVNASATRQGIIVKHFPTPDTADTVMYCYWPTEEADKPECESNDGFSLVGQLTDQVVAKVPVSRLMDSGAYKCQLYPLGDHEYFNPCYIHHSSDNDEGKPSVVTTPVVSSTATDHSTSGQDPLIREAPPCVGQSGSVELTAVLVLQVIITILLVVNVLCLRNRKSLQGKDGCMKVGRMMGRPWNSSEKSSVRSEGEPMNGPEG